MSKKSDTDEDKMELSPLVDASKSKEHSKPKDAAEPIAGTSYVLTSEKHPVPVVSGKVYLSFSEYWEAIEMAIQKDDDKELKAILDKNMDQAYYSLKGWGIHYQATVRGSIKCLTYLTNLEMFDINTRDETGKTLLHFAAIRGQEESVKFLLVKGIDINCRDKTGRLPLHYAVETGDLQCIRFLVEKGSKINCRDKTGRLPLHYAAKSWDHQCIRLLVEKGSEINCRDKDGCLPLHYAAKFGPKATLALLLDKSCDINCRDNYGMTGLHYAVKSEREIFVKMFLKRKADINARDEGRPTVIMIAANAADSIFQSLLEEHPDTTLRNDSGQTVFHVLSDEDKKATQQKISNLKKLLEFEIWAEKAEKKQAVSVFEYEEILYEETWNPTQLRKKTARELIVDDQSLAMNIIRVLLRDGRLDFTDSGLQFD